MKRLLIFLAACQSTPAPSGVAERLQALLSPEMDVDAPIIGLAASDAFWPVSASDGTNHLVAWNDGRPGQGIYGTRVAPTGEVLDPDGLKLASGKYGALAFDGTHYLLAYWNTGIEAVLVGTDGVPLGTPLAVAATAPMYAPQVAFDGTEYLVSWDDSADHGQLARISTAGALVDATPVDIGVAYGAPSLAFDGTNWWMAWLSNGVGVDRIMIGRARPADLQLLDGRGLVVDARFDEDAPCLACTGGTCLVSWAIAGAGANYPYGAHDPELHAVRFASADGTILDQPLLASPAPAYQPAVITDGGDYLVTWTDYEQWVVKAARVRAADGALLDGSPIVMAPPNGDEVYLPALSWNGANYLVAWIDRLAFDKIRGARMTPAGAVLDSPSLLLSALTGPNDELTPAVAGGAGGYLAAWQDSRSGTWDVYATRLDADGHALDAPAIAVSGRTGAASLEHVATAGSGQDYLVAWASNAGVYAARVGGDGTLLDSPPLVVAQGPYYILPLVAFTGRRYLVAMTYIGAGVPGSWIKLATVDSDGTVTLLPGRIVPAVATGLACDGTRCLVMAADSDGDYFRSYSQLGAFIDDDGTIEPTFTLSPPSANWWHQQDGAAAFDGTRYLAVWQGWSESGPGELLAARLAPDGTLLDPSPSPVATLSRSPDSSPSVVWEGRNFLAAWSDTRGGSALDAFGARISSAGNVLDPDGIHILVDPVLEGSPALAGTAGRALAVYARADSDGLTRVHLRVFDDGDQSFVVGAACTAGADCQSGHCADGVCCATACDNPCATCAGGTCLPTASPSPIDHARCAGLGTVCAGACDGTHLNCVYPEVVCSVASCVNGSQVTGVSCDGAGGCPTVQSNCYPYRCGASACATSCAVDEDCEWPTRCVASHCTIPDMSAPADLAPPPADGGAAMDGAVVDLASTKVRDAATAMDLSTPAKDLSAPATDLSSPRIDHPPGCGCAVGGGGDQPGGVWILLLMIVLIRRASGGRPSRGRPAGR